MTDAVQPPPVIKTKRQKVAVVVFMEIDNAVDDIDAYHIAEQLLKAQLPAPDVLLSMTKHRIPEGKETWYGKVRAVMELGRAGANGYITSKPSLLPYRRSW